MLDRLDRDRVFLVMGTDTGAKAVVSHQHESEEIFEIGGVSPRRIPYVKRLLEPEPVHCYSTRHMDQRMDFQQGDGIPDDLSSNRLHQHPTHLDADQGFGQHIGFALVPNSLVGNVHVMAMLGEKSHAFGRNCEARHGVVKMANVNNESSHSHEEAVQEAIFGLSRLLQWYLENCLRIATLLKIFFGHVLLQAGSEIHSQRTL